MKHIVTESDNENDSGIVLATPRFNEEAVEKAHQVEKLATPPTGAFSTVRQALHGVGVRHSWPVMIGAAVVQSVLVIGGILAAGAHQRQDVDVSPMATNPGAAVTQPGTEASDQQLRTTVPELTPDRSVRAKHHREPVTLQAPFPAEQSTSPGRRVARLVAEITGGSQSSERVRKHGRKEKDKEVEH